MLISEFAKATELPVDTIRFYISKGLLKPERSAKGGSNPYQLFSQEDVTAARMIRLQQTLGYSLREIQALNDAYRAGESSPARTVEILQTQIARLEERKAALDAALSFLRGKVDWIKAGKPDTAPQLEDYRC
ncbi:MerR family transcriptional regulator [Ensifer sp. ENS07]|jgi:MerR family copper efflux transcriptional regulator|uniref:MerR family transcriptional regulator n=1 Tax=Ensifer adhaerens TaxID=106592 RepID=A0A9Q9D872_ENSAD|nr:MULTISPECIES: MerR family transcriptional regulator [Ensifer]OWZ94484.1 MerR family transcriptional regulator [Sinorhizobium sp. LM21]MBD9636573.1 MerR family transcriptional regulator [Ensifer sp. ENS07]NUS68573.1 MerR family transcriptional regulator [Ensifer adhaerens]USJ21667.1 MerR family transcriptional regulator [Ensifer adhaerens]UTV34977.1 MerR family transcriptional regulator [Ensifer adhaerens]